MDSTYGNINLSAYTLVPDNATYLNCYKSCPIAPQPMSGPTVGLMMLLSTLQYQAPYMNPVYANAASQAGKAAYIQSGGQAMQNKLTSQATDQTKDFAHSIGITDTEMGVVLGTAKVVRDKQLDVNGPKIYFIKTHLTVGEDHGSIGLGINF